ncbi:hypothetical protein [Ferrimonas kyonanensis]|uniref:hypothetical protein n=1 Tax=Ferrimonas kyonanensis TaxID=364763 RepID=UPI000486A8D4|nr:hypothetical protein [Ferrimonas kyonanensis]
MNYPPEIEADWNQYNELRESGLKKQANRALLNIVKKIENIGPEKFKGFLFSLCEDGLGKNHSRKIQYPIFVKCILPLLLRGFELRSAKELVYLAKANQSGFGKEVYKAIGDVCNRDLLKEALLVDPENIVAKNMLAADYIEELYFGAHHLPDTLITDLKTANSTIKESAEFLLKNGNCIEDQLIEGHKYYSRLYKDYEEWFSGNYTYGFCKWCEENNRKYGWVKSYYYK